MPSSHAEFRFVSVIFYYKIGTISICLFLCLENIKFTLHVYNGNVFGYTINGGFLSDKQKKRDSLVFLNVFRL